MDQETKRLLSKAVLTIEEAGTVLGMCRNSAYSAAKRGDIPTIKIGKLLKVPAALLRAKLGLEAA
jgi:hypothetical protein